MRKDVGQNRLPECSSKLDTASFGVGSSPLPLQRDKKRTCGSVGPWFASKLRGGCPKRSAIAALYGVPLVNAISMYNKSRSSRIFKLGCDDYALGRVVVRVGFIRRMIAVMVVTYR
jgi:hypothetical protein